MSANQLFVSVPTVTLPCGIAVRPFLIGKYLCGRDTRGRAIVSSTAAPWVYLDYAEAIMACDVAGVKLVTELRCLAIAYDIVMQDINWTGGKVGAGAVFQGLHKGTVTSAQPGDFVSDDPEERRWHQLSNGEIIVDFAGNVCSWVFDDVQGDAQGLAATYLDVDSPSITTAPYPSMERGMGWRPWAGRDWSGYALSRGGNWYDMRHTGVFYLGFVSPDYRQANIGFRCTR